MNTVQALGLDSWIHQREDSRNPMETLHDNFGKILEYPRPGYIQQVSKCASLLDLEIAKDPGPHPELLRSSEMLKRYIAAISALTDTEREEQYTFTFDINPVSCLNVGWHLYGENYDRGAFLVKMRELLRQHQIQESAELPDYLPHVLALLGRLEDTEATEFHRTYVMPALNKILEGIASKGYLYETVLQAANAFLLYAHSHEIGELNHG